MRNCRAIVKQIVNFPSKIFAKWPQIIQKMIPNRYKCVLGGHLALNRAHAYMGHLAFDAFGAEYGAPWTHFGAIRVIWGASLGLAGSKKERKNQ